MLIHNERWDNAAITVVELVEAASLNDSNRYAGIFCELRGNGEASSPATNDAALQLSASLISGPGSRSLSPTYSRMMHSSRGLRSCWRREGIQKVHSRGVAKRGVAGHQKQRLWQMRRL